MNELSNLFNKLQSFNDEQRLKDIAKDANSEDFYTKLQHYTYSIFDEQIREVKAAFSLNDMELRIKKFTIQPGHPFIDIGIWRGEKHLAHTELLNTKLRVTILSHIPPPRYQSLSKIPDLPIEHFIENNVWPDLLSQLISFIK